MSIKATCDMPSPHLTLITRLFNMRIFIVFWCTLYVFAGSYYANAKTSLTESVHASNAVSEKTELIMGAEQLSTYLPLLEGKRVGLVVNQSALLREFDVARDVNGDVKGGVNFTGESKKDKATPYTNSTHLLDKLLAKNINVTAVLSPEHGFRGDKGAGEKINSDIDAKTGLPIFSLYGKTKKPTPEMLSDIDTLVFDIQDVGVRFYTYLSTLHYVIEAAFENNIDVIVLDRPNPNGRFVDGPTLESAFSSFVGMHPIPVLHGMTLGELGQMMIGEGWVNVPESHSATFTVIPVLNYQRNFYYSLPVPPSPNLPNDLAIQLYPTLCFFEGTDVSIGRGTDFPFQLIGHPLVQLGNEKISVKSTSAAPYPKHENETLFAEMITQKSSFRQKNNFKQKSNAQISQSTFEGIHVETLLNAYAKFTQKDNTPFFTRAEFFDKLAGTNKLRFMIESGESAEEIRRSWQPDLHRFKKARKPYLLYK